jgi:hypothetical protein
MKKYVTSLRITGKYKRLPQRENIIYHAIKMLSSSGKHETGCLIKHLKFSCANAHVYKKTCNFNGVGGQTIPYDSIDTHKKYFVTQ